MMLPFVVLAIIQVLDVAVHVATGQIEPVRLASNAVLLLGAGAAMITRTHASTLLLAAGAAYLALNMLFLAQHGLVNPTTDALRIPLFGFVVGSLLSALWLRRRLADPQQS